MNPAVPGAGLMAVKLAASLGVIVALILLLQRAARRWGGSLGAGSGAESIRLLSQRAVGPRLSLAVIEVRGRTLLVGIAPHGIRRVADLGPARGTVPAESAAGSPEAAAVPPGALAQGGTAGSAGARRVSPIRGLWARLAGRRGTAAEEGGATPRGARRRRAGRRGSPKGVPPSTPDGIRPSSAGGGRLPSPEAVGAPLPVTFETELDRRLTTVRDRYRTIAEVEQGAEAGCR